MRDPDTPSTATRKLRDQDMILFRSDRYRGAVDEHGIFLVFALGESVEWHLTSLSVASTIPELIEINRLQCGPDLKPLLGGQLDRTVMDFGLIEIDEAQIPEMIVRAWAETDDMRLLPLVGAQVTTKGKQTDWGSLKEIGHSFGYYLVAG